MPSKGIRDEGDPDGHAPRYLLKAIGRKEFYSVWQAGKENITAQV